MAGTADLRDTALVIAAADLYVGSGNMVSYWTEVHGLEHRMVDAQSEHDVEVIVYIAPDGRRSSTPQTVTSTRCFEWVPKTALTSVGNQRVQVTA